MFGTASGTQPVQKESMNGMASLRAKRKKQDAQASQQMQNLPKAPMPDDKKKQQAARFAAMTRANK